MLAGSEPGDRVELPAEVYRLLRQVIEALRANLAVTVKGPRRSVADVLDILESRYGMVAAVEFLRRANWST